MFAPFLLFCSFSCLVCGLCRKYLALVDPDFDADLTIGSISFREAVVDIGTQCLKRNGSLGIRLCTGNISTAQTAAAGGLDAERAILHGPAHGGLHGTAEGNTVLKLLRDILSDQLRVLIGALDLLDIKADFLTGQLCQLGAGLLDLSPALADDHAGLCRVNDNSDSAGCSLNFDLGDTGIV